MISTGRVAVIVVGCGLVAAWAAASAGACVYARGAVATVAPAAPAAREDVISGGIRLAVIESPSPPNLSPRRRNLFRVRERPVVSAPALPQRVATAMTDEPVDVTLALMPLTLAGIGESQHSERTVRTAVISGAGELWLVTEGMVAAGRYRIDRIDKDGVVLVDTASGQSRTLRLR